MAVEILTASSEALEAAPASGLLPALETDVIENPYYFEIESPAFVFGHALPPDIAGLHPKVGSHVNVFVSWQTGSPFYALWGKEKGLGTESPEAL
jgi:hypothetical protein